MVMCQPLAIGIGGSYPHITEILKVVL